MSKKASLFSIKSFTDGKATKTDKLMEIKWNVVLNKMAVTKILKNVKEVVDELYKLCDNKDPKKPSISGITRKAPMNPADRAFEEERKAVKRKSIGSDHNSSKHRKLSGKSKQSHHRHFTRRSSHRK